ncbi:MAG: hypothetical protein IPM56_08710 [Ignavibacteriales bacterium]|nr:MAG: hypothetical protein IPM56_08710 [Ignavibacteriales bacterium]
MVVINQKLFWLYKFTAVVMILFIIVFGYIFFEPYLTEREIVITVVNFEKFPKENGKYYIFTTDEVFENTNYYYHKKNNADRLITKFIKGDTYRVKVVGFYLPAINRFRNIIDIVEYNIRTRSNV